MTHPARWAELKQLFLEELRRLAVFSPSTRMWQMPVAAALASGLPLLVGAYFNHMDYGLVSSLGGLVFLYLPGTPLHHRMAVLMACAFALTACFALGVMSHFVPLLMMPVLIFIAMLVTMACRFYGVGVPGSLFFIMAAAIGAYSPVEVLQVPLMVGLIAMGTLLAWLIAFFYSVTTLRLQAPTPVPRLRRPSFDFVVFDSVVIGVFVGISLALAQVLALPRPYWVPVSCLAIIQGASVRAVWTKPVQRLIGTLIGLLLSWGLLSMPMDPWTLALTMIGLTVVIETLVVRNYAFAAIFITPLTILLAEAATLGHGASPAVLIQARLVDTVLGCLVGLVGGLCLHSPRFRAAVGGPMRRLIPARFVR